MLYLFNKPFANHSRPLFLGFRLFLTSTFEYYELNTLKLLKLFQASKMSVVTSFYFGLLHRTNCHLFLANWSRILFPGRPRATHWRSSFNRKSQWLNTFTITTSPPLLRKSFALVVSNVLFFSFKTVSMLSYSFCVLNWGAVIFKCFLSINTNYYF